MHFRLCYITGNFEFGDKQIHVSDPARKISVSLRKRLADDAPLKALPIEAGDGVVIATCERVMTERVLNEVVGSGQLSLKKEAVGRVYSEMYGQILRTIRLIRWRTNSDGGPHPIRSGMHGGFTWSLDGNEWKAVADYIRATLSMHVNPEWTTEAEQFVAAEISGEVDEPLAHELLREAWTNRGANPRSCIVLAVAAAEVGFKQFASKTFPDAAWILENIQSPPLFEMLTKLFPWTKLNLKINGTDLTPPDSVTAAIKTAVHLRNDIVHGRGESPSSKTAHSVLTAVRDLLYFLDAVQGQQWALYHLSAEARKHFPQIAWPLLLTPTVT